MAVVAEVDVVGVKVTMAALAVVLRYIGITGDGVHKALQV